MDTNSLVRAMTKAIAEQYKARDAIAKQVQQFVDDAKRIDPRDQQL